MIFLIDHCIWQETENILHRAGFSCISLRQLGKSEACNGEIIALARTNKAILVTRDRDFSNVSLYPLGTHEGIILLRITPKSINDAHKVLLEALQRISPERLKGSLLIITSNIYRLHQHKQ